MDKALLNFLNRHRISFSAVFDATDMRPKDFKPLMKALGKTIAIGVRPCKAAGHRIRDRHNHCLPCQP